MEVSIDEQLSSALGVQQALAGIYRDTESLLSERFVVYSDLMGGNLTFTPDANDGLVTIPGAVANVYNFSENEMDSDFEDYYEGLYELINQVNLILDRTDTFDFFTTEENQQLQAELLTFRALAHYQVAIHYAQNFNSTSGGTHLGIVYSRSFVEPGVDFPARLTLSETYERIQIDLEKALSFYTDETTLTGEPSYAYLTAISARALYARIALQMNDWEQAASLADAVISTAGISLTSSENYIAEWEQTSLPINEVILEFSAPRDSDGETVSSSISEHFRVTNSDYADYVSSGDLLNTYSSEDIRRDMFIEVQLPTVINQVEIFVPYYFTKKFQDDAGTTFIRLSEMYLIRAEANARLENAPLALDDLNTIRERAGLSPILSTDDLIEQIFLERRRELAFEGHLFFDMKRFQKDIIRDEGCISLQCDLTYPSNFFVLPIPFSSSGLNQNIIQNAGY